MTDARHTHKSDTDALVNALLGDNPEPINSDLNKRSEESATAECWQATSITGLQICVLEYICLPVCRLTALLRVDPAIASVQLPAANIELLTHHGMVTDDDTEYMHPFFLRNPADESGVNQVLTLHAGSHSHPDTDGSLEFYIATGQLAQTDRQRRCINLADSNLWLPGPVENTEVMPLHMHNGNNSMLIRWLAPTSFKPRLDPRGEEVLVISGELSDAHGSYKAGSWIRNPEVSWQTWSGIASTLVYYKNGHFGNA